MTSVVTNAFNLIDTAIWYDYTVDHNIIYHNGQFTTQAAPTSCIADFPPAYHGVIDANICHMTPSPGVNVDAYGIAVGWRRRPHLQQFHVEGAGSAAGIVCVVSAAGPIRGIRIIGNTVKNNGNRNPGLARRNRALSIASNPPDLAGLSDIIISGNHSYDDQANKTQGYGIGITLADKAHRISTTS